MASKAELEFFHHLHDTLILLGAGERFAKLVENPQAIKEFDVNDLRRYNGKLIDAMKQKMVDINKLAIEVKRDEDPS